MEGWGSSCRGNESKPAQTMVAIYINTGKHKLELDKPGKKIAEQPSLWFSIVAASRLFCSEDSAPRLSKKDYTRC